MLSVLLLTGIYLQAQETFFTNGVADNREGCYAFTNATIVKDAQTTLSNATMVIRQGKIIAVGNDVSVPKDAIVIDCKDKYIYPSLIDIYSDYGITPLQRQGGSFSFFGPAQLTSNQKGAYGWNQALKPDVEAYKIFVTDDGKAKPLRDIGFGAVLTHQKDGIARGTGALVTLANEKENLVIIKERATNHLSFNKGVSTQSYPSSLMGSIALLRQTYLDAQWYKTNPSTEGTNITLKTWNENQAMPQIMDPISSNDLWMVMRADRVGDEFGVQYIIKATGKEYQRIKEVAATKAPLIVSLNYPQAQDVEDPNDARLVSLADLKNWELAPTNPGALEKAGINFCLTTADLKDSKSFWANLRKAIEYGLTEKAAMDALTKNPATLLGVYDKVGSLDAGKLANFLITSGPLFAEKTTILNNWVQGKKYGIKEDVWFNIAGSYTLTTTSEKGTNTYNMDVKNATSANIIGKDTLPVKLSYDGKIVKFSFAPEKKSKASIRFSGFNNNGVWNGTAADAEGNRLLWTASLSSPSVAKADSIKPKPVPSLSKITYPFTAFGSETVPSQENYVIKNATVWTNEKDGKLDNTDVLVKAGKIVQVGKNITDPSAKIIDGTGKHLTAGIIDEHSHIAAISINEGAQSVTSEVRIGDNIDPEDINIYRQLSGGVTTSHILHGSANTIGGQTQLIKLRWGADDEGLKFKGADPFIKFALGENVKRTASPTGNNRFPDTRMGVEQVLMDAFTRAKEYENKWKEADANNKKKGATPMYVRRDLELDALVEIMNKKRFITCHSYVASEIISTMRIAEKFGFTVNTFTHILEGYKAADKMKAHGANASTFSDWWAYKLEVQDAIPYNPYIMNAVGLNVCINSDDAEMARRLNQEAAKSVKYGGMSEEDALKMITLNPAKALHIADKTGSIKVGKDADLVLWSDNPLSIYAKALYTMVDGVIYFDREKDAAMRKQIAAERTKLINKMAGEKKEGRPTVGSVPSYKYVQSCGDDHGHKLGLLEVAAEEE